MSRFIGALLALILSLVAYMPLAWGAGEYVAGEVIVGFKVDTSEQTKQAFESEYGLQILSDFPNINARHYRLPGSLPVADALVLLARHPAVQYVEPNFIQRRQSLPDDTHFAEQWYLQNTAQVVNGVTGSAGIDINWMAARDAFDGTRETIIAVVDSGVSLDHPELLPRLWVNPHEMPGNGIDDDGNGLIDDVYGWDFFDNDAMPLDENGHGTLVASLIGAAVNNGIGTAGVSPLARLMVLRVGNDLGSISTSASISAFTYAANNGARIINYSAGGAPYSASMYSAIQWLGGKDVLLVAAAGNGGADHRSDNNDLTPFYPASYALDNIISVAAIDAEGQLATFSNYGSSTVHIAAPGTNILGASPNFTTVFSDSFGTGGAGWTQGHLSGSSTLYNWSIYVDGYGRHWITDSVNSLGQAVSYAAYTNSYARTPAISVGYATLLTYRIWNQLEYFFDWLVVEASSDGGSTWSPIDLVTGYSYGACPSCSTAAGSVRRVDLSRFGLQNKTIYVRFRIVTDWGGNYDGVYLDEITVKQVSPFQYDGTQYQIMNGTSFSAPLVAGTAALLWSQRPDLNYAQIRSVLLSSAKAKANLSGIVSSGGMLDAGAALLAAKALPAAHISFSPAAVDFGDQIIGVTSAASTVTLTNSGDAALTITARYISVSKGFSASDNCPSQITAGAGCQILVTFTPASTGAVNGSLSVTGNAPELTRSVILNGAGVVATTTTTSTATPTTTTTSTTTLIASTTTTAASPTTTTTATTSSTTTVTGTTTTTLAQTSLGPFKVTLARDGGIAWNAGGIIPGTEPCASGVDCAGNPYMTVSATISFNAADVGKPGAVFVTATVPEGTLGTSVGSGQSSFALVQLTSSGWQPVANGQLVPYASGVLGDQLAAVTILNSQVNTSLLKGAQFCVGYGTSASEMTAAGRMQLVAFIAEQTVMNPGCVVDAPLSYSLVVQQGWNLLGNSLNQTLSVASLFNDPNVVISVWKWDAGISGWQFYTPLMTATELQTYAASKGYAVLAAINPGEGYWVNAKAQPTLGIQEGTPFTLKAGNLATGWNLVATGSNVTPSAFNQTLGGAPLATLWAWDSSANAWYFYAPSLEAKGGTVLKDYIVSKGYLDFAANNKILGQGLGFWVNKP